MITFDYLKKAMRGFVNAEGHTIDAGRVLVDAPDFMEGMTQLVQTKGVQYAILFEEAYHYDDDNRNDVPVTRFDQSIYVMRMARGDKPNRPDELLCFEDVKRLRALLLHRQAEGDPEMKGWTRRAYRDFVEGGSNFVGWKLRLEFVENEDWTYGEG